jgi:hypothetical protein
MNQPSREASSFVPDSWTMEDKIAVLGVATFFLAIGEIFSNRRQLPEPYLRASASTTVGLCLQRIGGPMDEPAN